MIRTHLLHAPQIAFNANGALTRSVFFLFCISLFFPLTRLVKFLFPDWSLPAPRFCFFPIACPCLVSLFLVSIWPNPFSFRLMRSVFFFFLLLPLGSSAFFRASGSLLKALCAPPRLKKRFFFFEFSLGSLSAFFRAVVPLRRIAQAPHLSPPGLSRLSGLPVFLSHPRR